MSHLIQMIILQSRIFTLPEDWIPFMMQSQTNSQESIRQRAIHHLISEDLIKNT